MVLHDVTERKLLERSVLAAVERERERTGRELHDGLCQLLTSTKFKTSLLEHKLASKSLAEAAEAKDIEKDLMQEIKQAVSIAHGLNPVKGLSRGLMAALEELAARVEGAFQLRCVCEFPTPVAIPDQTAAHHLYRITQEAVNNAVKHGKGRNIRIQLKNARGGIVLKVFDDGVGLPRTLERKGGMGLQNLNARASLIGASLDIRCAQPHGK